MRRAKGHRFSGRGNQIQRSFGKKNLGMEKAEEGD